MYIFYIVHDFNIKCEVKRRKTLQKHSSPCPGDVYFWAKLIMFVNINNMHCSKLVTYHDIINL